MPAYNPIYGTQPPIEAWDGSPLIDLATLATAPVNVVSAASQGAVQQLANQGNSSNAAGTSENIAMDMAVIVVIAGVLVWFLRHSGIRFVVGGSVG